MELRQLETFVCVADKRSFTRAAEDLNLTQPAVTRQIASLETELHTRLLERMGRHVERTASGDALYVYAVEIMRLMGEAQRAVSDVASGVSGHLSVGASSTAATYVLPPLLKRFKETYPAVELSISTGVSSRIVEMVFANKVDVGIVMDFRGYESIVETPLTEYATVVVVYPDHPLAIQARKEGRTTVHTSELSGSPLILMEEGTNLRTYVDRLLSSNGVEEQVSLELDNVEAIKKMIEARLGISLLPLIALQAEVETGRLVALPLDDVPAARRRISAIHRVDKYLSASIRAFLHRLLSELNDGEQ